DQVSTWQNLGFEVRCLHQDEQQNDQIICELDSITNNELAQLVEQGNAVILVGEHQLNVNPKVVTFSYADIHHIHELIQKSLQVRDQIDKNLVLVKFWNFT